MFVFVAFSQESVKRMREIQYSLIGQFEVFKAGRASEHVLMFKTFCFLCLCQLIMCCRCLGLHVNQGGTNRNRCRLVILHAQTY